MNLINELLRKMSETERMEWIINAKCSYLNVALKDGGVKGIASMKKLEKRAYIKLKQVRKWQSKSKKNKNRKM